MAAPTDLELTELLNYHFSAALLKEFARDTVQADFKSNSKLKSAEAIVAKTSSSMILDFVFKNFHASRHNTYVFELSESNSFNLSGVKRNIGAFRNPDTDKYLYAGRDEKSAAVNLLMPANVMAQVMNSETLEVSGRIKTIRFLLPVRVVFHPPKYLKIKFFKFAPGSDHALSSGELIHINKVVFDETSAIRAIQEDVVSSLNGEDFVECNLVSGVKELIKNQDINAMVATADDEDNEGEDRRTKHNTKKCGPFLERAWLQEKLLKSDNIKRGKWFWIKGINLKSTTIGSLTALTIEPTIGMLAKDANRDEDFEWFIDEVIAKNR